MCEVRKRSCDSKSGWLWFSIRPIINIKKVYSKAFSLFFHTWKYRGKRIRLDCIYHVCVKECRERERGDTERETHIERDRERDRERDI